jgi:hypothetical protein
MRLTTTKGVDKTPKTCYHSTSQKLFDRTGPLTDVRGVSGVFGANRWETYFLVDARKEGM